VVEPEPRLSNIPIREWLRPARTLWGQLVRYGLAGGIAAAVNFGVYAVSWRLLHATWPRYDYQVANVIGFLCGNLVSYELSTRFVFNYHRLRRRTREFGAYFIIGVGGLAWSALILWLLVGLLHLHKDFAKLITVAMVFGWHFAARKMLLFTRFSEKSVAELRPGPLTPEARD
jgi:putative flippase GtrA